MLKATILGNIGSDPELRYSANGQPFLRFDVASNGRTRTPAGEWMHETSWVRVIIFGQRAETLAVHLARGTRVYADGRLEARPWIDRSGEPRAGLELLADTVEFVGRQQDRDDDQPVRASVADERRDTQRMPESMAVHGGRPVRGTAAVAVRDEAGLEDLPF